MEIGVRSTPVGRLAEEALVLPLFEKEEAGRAVAAAGRVFTAPYKALCASGAFTGAVDEVRVLHAGGGERIRMLAVAGLGARKAADPEVLRRAVASACRAVRDAGARSVSVSLPGDGRSWLRADRAAQAAVEGAVLGLYRFEEYKSKRSKTAVDALTVLAPRGESARVERGASRATSGTTPATRRRRPTWPRPRGASRRRTV